MVLSDRDITTGKGVKEINPREQVMGPLNPSGAGGGVIAPGHQIALLKDKVENLDKVNAELHVALDAARLDRDNLKNFYENKNHYTSQVPKLPTLEDRVKFLREYGLHEQRYTGAHIYALAQVVADDIDGLKEKYEREQMHRSENITMLQCEIKNRDKCIASLGKKVDALKEANASLAEEIGERARADREEELREKANAWQARAWSEANADAPAESNAEQKGWETGGTKYDSGKPRHDLIDPYAMDVLAQVLTFGASKYAAHNWRKGIAYSRLIAAALRHINAISAGDDLDSETGLPHAAHAMCCMMFLTWMRNSRADMDDRWIDDRYLGEPQEKGPYDDELPSFFYNTEDEGSWREEMATRLDEDPFPNRINAKVPLDTDGKETDLINQAAKQADALFSQYGLAPRAKEWVPFKIGDGTVISTGDIIKLKGRGYTWVIKEIDVQKLTIAVAHANAPDAVLMAMDIPMSDIEQVQR